MNREQYLKMNMLKTINTKKIMTIVESDTEVVILQERVTVDTYGTEIRTQEYIQRLK